MASAKQVATKEERFHPISAHDFLPRNHLEQLQTQRLKQMITLAYTKSGINDPKQRSIYKERMDSAGLAPDDFTTLRDLHRFPFTMKSDLRDSYPYGMFTCPMSEVVRLHASSGTTGKPIVVGYTKEDLHIWTEVMMRSMAGVGIHKHDVVNVAYGYGLFTGGLGAHCGAEGLECTVVPASVGNTDRQVMLLKDFGVTAICCTPSYFLHLIDRAAGLGVDVKKCALRCGLFGAEPWTEGMRERIEEAMGGREKFRAYDIYGLSEIIGPGVATECMEQSGAHIFEDHFYPEIIDPATGEVLPDGEEGELVLTTLSKYAQPMIRYRTRDITAIDASPCACGRTIRRLCRIGRRSDDMMIISGVNVFPSQIEAAILKIEGVAPHFEIILTRERDLDHMEVRVEYVKEIFKEMGDSVRNTEALIEKIATSVKSITGVRATIRLVEPQTIDRSVGKAKRVIDKRNLN